MSLYNEVRPLTLDEVRGQVPVKAKIKGMLAKGSVPNASLFIGPRGTGKTTVARILARAMNCSNPTSDGGPCNCCQSCIAALNGSNLDIVEIDAASHGNVADARELIENAALTPLSKYKIYIIDEVHMLSGAAFNAFLKTFEEPPAHCKFILCTTEAHKVPATIKSRCSILEFTNIDLDTIVSKLSDICDLHQVKYEPDALRLIAKSSDGSMRSAESTLESFLSLGDITLPMVEDILGLPSEDIVFSFITALSEKSSSKAMEIVGNCYDKGLDLVYLLKSVLEILTDLIYYLQSGGDVTMLHCTATCIEGLKRVSKNTSANEVSKWVVNLGKVLERGGKDLQPFIINAAILTCCVDDKLAMGSPGITDNSELEAKVKELESTCEALYNALDELRVSAQTPAVSSNDTAPDAPENEEEIPLYCSMSEEENYDIPPISYEDRSVDNGANDVLVDGVSKEPTDAEISLIPADTDANLGNDYLPGDVLLPKDSKVVGSISLNSIFTDSPLEVTNVIPKEDAAPIISTSINGVEFDGVRDVSASVTNTVTDNMVPEPAAPQTFNEEPEEVSPSSDPFADIFNAIPIMAAFK